MNFSRTEGIGKEDLIPGVFLVGMNILNQCHLYQVSLDGHLFPHSTLESS